MTYRCVVKWSSGVERNVETEQSKGEFLTSLFGHPERLPDGVTITDLEVEDAPKEREVKESNLAEHNNGDSSRKTEGSSSGDSSVQSRKVKEKDKKVEE